MKPGEVKYVVTVTRVSNDLLPRSEWRRQTDTPGQQQYADVRDEWWKEAESQIYRQEVDSIDMPALTAMVNRRQPETTS